MALKTNVVDRVSAYPGRVKLTPVSGQANTYDMVRADQPTQAGTPLNAALFRQKSDVLTQDVTVYVTKSGNDSSGEGTSAKPYLTVQKALDSIPKNLGGYVATVHIGPGTYDEELFIENFHGGRVTLTGATTTTVTFTKQITIRDCYVHFEYFKVIMSGAYVYVTQGGKFFLGDSVTMTCNGGQYGVFARYNAKVSLGGDIIVNNTTGAAVRVGACSDMYVHNISGTGNKVAFYGAGGYIRYNISTIEATTVQTTVTGGRVYTGSQTSAGKY